MKRKINLLLALLLLSVSCAFAQKLTVKGTVLDETGQTIIGATVREKGVETNGTATDMDGHFTLTVSQGATIVVSYVGYQTQEVKAATQMTIKMVPDNELLDEVVVVGYMTRKVANTSASVVKVSSKDLQEKPTANPMDALQGKVSGMQVFTSSGEPSEFSSVRLHGAGSLGAGSAPLYIMDGMPVSASTVMSTNPNDFESVQVLKDAAATSIYGARAANGVIYITTKRGRASERATITFRGQYGISNLANPSYYNKMMSTDELLQLWQDVGLKNADQIKEIRDKYGDTNYTWWKYFLRQNTPTYQGDVAISGGRDDINYYVSGGGFKQQGMRAGSDYSRFNLRSNLNARLNPIIRMGLNMGLNYDYYNLSPYGRNWFDGGGIAHMNLPYFSPIDPKTGKEYEGFIPGINISTPELVTSKMPSTNKTLHYSAMGNVVVTPFRGLTLRSQAGLELSDYVYDRLAYASHPWQGGSGFATRDFSRSSNWTFTNTAQYVFSIADVNHFTALLGHEYIDYKYHYFEANSNGQQDDDFNLLPSGPNRRVGESISEYAFLSLFGQLSYDYAERYFIDLVLRNDASSRFAPSKRNALFWSVGLLWKAKKESFLESVDWLNELDVKFSIGTQGNAGIGNYEFRPLVVSSGFYNGSQAFVMSQPGNPDLGWESQRKITAGITAQVLKSLSFNVEYYHRLTTGMLMNDPLPLETGVLQDDDGFASIRRNVGEYLNQGVDLRVDYDILKGRDYGLSAYLNFNYNMDKVLKLFQGRDRWVLPGYGYGYFVGKPVSFVYPIFKGVNPETGKSEWYLPGEDMAVTQKDDSKITTKFSEALEQNTGIRQMTPMVGGFGLSGSYKGLSLQADFTYAWGKHMISNDLYFTQNPYLFDTWNQEKEAANFWRKPGDRVTLPSPDFARKEGQNRFRQFDSFLIQDASFIRLKNLTLGYQLPTSLLESQEIVRGAKVYLTGRNLLTFTRFQGPDPEVDSNLSLGAYPNSRQFIIGFELGF